MAQLFFSAGILRLLANWVFQQQASFLCQYLTRSVLELASVGFEVLINEMDEQFASFQYAGVESKIVNLIAYSLAKKIPNIRKLFKEMIIQVLESPVFLHSDE